MSLRNAGLYLIAAAALFWLSWWLMPGVGVTDSATIFELVSRQRSSVMLSVITQLLSSVFYVPALLGISCSMTHKSETKVRWGAGLLLLGAMGSAIDAVLHLLAYAMTMPGLERTELLKVMAFMQGPGLRLFAPLIISFFAGSILLSVTLSKAGSVSRAGSYMHLAAVALALVGGIAASRGILSGRTTGLLVLAAISLAQASVGFELRLVINPLVACNMLINQAARIIRPTMPRIAPPLSLRDKLGDNRRGNSVHSNRERNIGYTLANYLRASNRRVAGRLRRANCLQRVVRSLVATDARRCLCLCRRASGRIRYRECLCNCLDRRHVAWCSHGSIVRRIGAHRFGCTIDAA